MIRDLNPDLNALAVGCIPVLFRFPYYDDNESDEETKSASTSLLRPPKHSSADTLRSVPSNEDEEESYDEQVDEEQNVKLQYNKRRHSEVGESVEGCNQKKFNEEDYCNEPVSRKSYDEEEQKQNSRRQLDEEESCEENTDYTNEMRNSQGTFQSDET